MFEIVSRFSLHVITNIVNKRVYSNFRVGEGISQSRLRYPLLGLCLFHACLDTFLNPQKVNPIIKSSGRSFFLHEILKWVFHMERIHM